MRSHWQPNLCWEKCFPPENYSEGEGDWNYLCFLYLFDEVIKGSKGFQTQNPRDFQVEQSLGDFIVHGVPFTDKETEKTMN